MKRMFSVFTAIYFLIGIPSVFAAEGDTYYEVLEGAITNILGDNVKLDAPPDSTDTTARLSSVYDYLRQALQAIEERKPKSEVNQLIRKAQLAAAEAMLNHPDKTVRHEAQILWNRIRGRLLNRRIGHYPTPGNFKQPQDEPAPVVVTTRQRRRSRPNVANTTGPVITQSSPSPNPCTSTRVGNEHLYSP